MKLPLYQVDAFTAEIFKGNPAAVIPLAEWLPPPLMQAIAAENNQSETAFFVQHEDYVDLTWFTPVSEVDLCGHATLASAHVLFSELGYARDVVEFRTAKAGLLFVKRLADNYYQLDFPSRPPTACIIPADIVKLVGSVAPVETLAARDYMLVYENETIIRQMQPDIVALRMTDRWICITAPADPASGADFVSRFFCPGDGIEEDPVTGSTHVMLAPYWSAKLGRIKLVGQQLSERGGKVICELKGDRVLLSGNAVTYLRGEITVQA